MIRKLFRKKSTQPPGAHTTVVRDRSRYALDAADRPQGEPVSITLEDLTVHPDGVDFEVLLQSWRWLVPANYTPVALTALGDLFLLDPEGHAYFLQTGIGTLTQVADSAESLMSKISDSENAETWFVPHLVGDLMMLGHRLTDHECYSYIVPPCLGGGYSVNNMEVSPLITHFDITGQINEQVKDMPEGTTIDQIQIQGM